MSAFGTIESRLSELIVTLDQRSEIWKTKHHDERDQKTKNTKTKDEEQVPVGDRVGSAAADVSSGLSLGSTLKRQRCWHCLARHIRSMMQEPRLVEWIT